MRTKLWLGTAVALSMAGLMAVAHTQTTNPTDKTGNPTQTRPATPAKAMTVGDVLGTVTAIDNNEIAVANYVLMGKKDYTDLSVGTPATTTQPGYGNSGTGNTGNTGNTDNTGTTGNTGSTGNTGNAGNTGGTGNTGNTGYDTTPTGTTGPSVSDDVRQYAQMLKTDHEKNYEETLALAKKLNIQISFKGQRAMTIKQKGKQDLATLVSMPAATGFDLSFVTAMIKGHTEALRIIDTELLPAVANNQEVKSHLTMTRAAVAHHLEAAKELQEKVSVGKM